ncbi:hypothetical protein A1O7_08481 [Cladophialophora yegresii CBS 114405]|uniref:Uncharacterized protein n=1 Tax=Cladophialophora yegresii CBS 114405 TaxID=1182544 RepID=W9VJ83_9EURO|nr:uncharacterized protein A1O7_08481 [Cladophialophora yegresii CBS 114405]EXJ55553.1 hypothetical protein A1O7_08481 [Cladophialophora yegresii CBS 114405]
MPKGPKSVGQLCAELGMDAFAETRFRKESQAYLKDHVADVPNASDEVIERLAVKYLDDGAGNKHFSWDAALNYQWEASGHRLTIVNYVGDIMKQQRWYIIDRLHKRVHGAVHCPGCLLHKPNLSSSVHGATDNGFDGQVDDATVFSEGSDAGSNHEDTNMDNGIHGGNDRKRTRASLGHESVSGNKRRKSGTSEGSGGAVEVGKHETQPLSTIDSRFPPPRASGFTPVNPSVAVRPQTASKPEAPAPAETLGQTFSLKDFSLTMRYRGKMWHFNSIAHKAKVLEQILLQEEKDVEAYPVLAFSKGVKTASLGGREDSDRDESALRDYFRFYTHFMNERFPSSEKILLENGVKPSA